MKKHHAYLIKWEDSATLAGWKWLDAAQRHTPDLITSIGWLVKETKTAMTITTSISEEANCMDVLCIPKSAIRKKTRLPNYIEGTPS